MKPLSTWGHQTALRNPAWVGQKQWDEALAAFIEDPSILEEAVKGLGPHWQTPAGARVAWLVREIETHNQLYYLHGMTEISDHAWDALFHELKDLEAANPKLVVPVSPTQRTGALQPSTLQRWK